MWNPKVEDIKISKRITAKPSNETNFDGFVVLDTILNQIDMYLDNLILKKIYLF